MNIKTPQIAIPNHRTAKGDSQSNEYIALRNECADLGEWTAIQVLLANVGKPATRVSPAQGKRKTDAQRGKGRHTAPASAKHTVTLAREGSKKSELIDLMRRSHLRS